MLHHHGAELLGGGVHGRFHDDPARRVEGKTDACPASAAATDLHLDGLDGQPLVQSGFLGHDIFFLIVP